MKKTRFLAGFMSAVMTISVAPVYAVEQADRMTVEQEITLEKMGTSNISDTDYKYSVPGGYIYFNESIGAITGADESITSANIPSTINGVAVTSIEEWAFYYCPNLTSITIPSSVTLIGEYAFSNCHSLTSITIPSSVTSIGEYAFIGCKSLTSITIPSSVTSIGSCAFYSCTSLENITVDENNLNYVSEDGILFSKDKTQLHTYPAGKTETSYSIPSSVTEIGVGAFYYCTSLASVTIPSSVTSIGSYAFYGCASLENITVDENNLNYVSEDGILFSKDKTQLHTYPARKTETSYSIPSSVTEIGVGAFYYCTSLISITIPSSVTSIGRSAFNNCTSLTSIAIPSSVTEIGNAAFWNCSILTSITIPSSVTSIENYAFYNCTSLTDVYYEGSQTEWEKINIYATSGNANLTDATIHYNSAMQEEEIITLPNAILYTSYESQISPINTILSGKLPTGLGIYDDGTILGIPTVAGTFAFSVMLNGDIVNYQITVLDNTSANIEADNDFEIIERVPIINDNAQDYIYEVSGEFDDFLAVYINGKKLVENVDYYAEEGSTKITILNQTMSTLPSGSNTINATFSANSGSVATVTPVVQSVAQNFTKTVEPVATSSMPFTDVAMLDWYYDSVEYIYKRDIMNGTSSTLFTPTSNINHAMLVTILYRMSGETASTESKYTDVVSDFWYTDAINWAVDNNITTPKTSTTFAPNELLNREQTAVIVKNYCDYMSIYLPMTTSAEVPDLENVSDSAKDAVTEMYQRGFLQGDANGNFNPTNNITRAQVATMINNFLMKI